MGARGHWLAAPTLSPQRLLAPPVLWMPVWVPSRCNLSCVHTALRASVSPGVGCPLYGQMVAVAGPILPTAARSPRDSTHGPHATVTLRTGSPHEALTQQLSQRSRRPWAESGAPPRAQSVAFVPAHTHQGLKPPDIQLRGPRRSRVVPVRSYGL